jgi:hypothetical protein
MEQATTRIIFCLRLTLCAALGACIFAAPAQAAVTISITPQGEAPWAEYTEVVVQFELNEPAQQAWQQVQSVTYELDGKNCTSEITSGAKITSPTSTKMKLTAQLKLTPGQHTLIVTLTPPRGKDVQASSTFNLIDEGGTTGTAEEFFGAAPYLLWPEDVEAQARTGKVALEGSYMFSIPGAVVVDAGFRVDEIEYHTAVNGAEYFGVTLDLPEGLHNVEAFIVDSAGYTYLSDPVELTLSRLAAAHAYPTHAPPATQQYGRPAVLAQQTSGGVPTQNLAGRFHLQLDVDGPGPDPFAPGGAPPGDDEYSFSWITSEDAVGSFDNCPPIIWRGDSFLWEYKFDRGDWKYHHMRISGEVSSDGRLLKKLALVDRYEGPPGSTVFSELTCTAVDVPLARGGKGAIAAARLAFSFEGKRWDQYLVSFTYDYSDSANRTRDTHYKLKDIQRARCYAAFW